MPKRNKIEKEIYRELMPLYLRKSWLAKKQDELLQLLGACKTAFQREMIKNMLYNFDFIDEDGLRLMLNEMAEYIVDESGFINKNTQILATTKDHEADSSQWIIQRLKKPMHDAGWRSANLINDFGKGLRDIKKGLNQIIIVDEFVGSGKTILNRIKSIENDAGSAFELKFCFMAGMDYALKIIEDKGYEVFCSLRLKKGISDYYREEELVDAVLNMKELENSLLRLNNNNDLMEYTFGYNNAQALFSAEDCSGNTPNSVFPIFWWSKDSQKSERKTLLTRFERGM